MEKEEKKRELSHHLLTHDMLLLLTSFSSFVVSRLFSCSSLFTKKYHTHTNQAYWYFAHEIYIGYIYTHTKQRHKEREREREREIETLENI